jgi:hypothetical protein
MVGSPCFVVSPDARFRARERLPVRIEQVCARTAARSTPRFAGACGSLQIFIIDPAACRYTIIAATPAVSHYEDPSAGVLKAPKFLYGP